MKTFDKLPEEERLLVYAKMQYRMNKVEPFRSKPSNMPVYLAIVLVILMCVAERC